MPLLLIAVFTHIVYKAISNGLDWTGEASRKAWGKSLNHSRSLADRARQRLTDTLDAWDQDPRGRRYAATGVRMALGTGRLLGKLGLGTVLAAAKGVGAVSRALAGGALVTGGLLGSLAGSARWGARAGADWWRNRHQSGGWSWLDWYPSWSKDLSERLARWGSTVPGQTGPDPYDERTEPKTGPTSGPRSTPNSDNSFSEHTPQPEPEREPTVTVVGWGDPVQEKAGDSTTQDPTPVGSTSAGAPASLGTATAVLDRPTGPVIEGEIVTTDLVPAAGNSSASISNAADGMKYEQSLAFLAEQERRARDLASMMEQLHALQSRVMEAASNMAADHSTAQAALAHFRIQAPNVAESIGLLTAAAHPAPAEHMVDTYMALDLVANGCRADADDLTARFGAAWETFKSEDVDAEYVNG